MFGKTNVKAQNEQINNKTSEFRFLPVYRPPLNPHSCPPLAVRALTLIRFACTVADPSNPEQQSASDRTMEDASGRDAAFFVFRAGEEVPDGATQLLIDGSVSNLRCGELPAFAFRGRSGLMEIAIEAGVKAIGEAAFCGCRSLMALKLGDGVATIGSYAFGNCVSLGDVTLPASVTEIRGEAFYGCKSLTMFRLRRGVLMIGERAFNGCHSLDQLAVPAKALLVINDWGPPSFQLADRLNPTSRQLQVIIISDCLGFMSETEMAGFKRTIISILGERFHLEGCEGWKEKHEQLRALLVLHELRYRKEASTLLELALWKVKIEEDGDSNRNNKEGCRLGCKATAIIPMLFPFLCLKARDTRQDFRLKCKANVIVPIVLSFL